MNSEEQKIKETFLENCAKKAEEFQTALNHSDFEKLESISHQLKGTSSVLGLKDLSEVCGDIENYAKKKNLRKIGECINEFIDLI